MAFGSGRSRSYVFFENYINNQQIRDKMWNVLGPENVPRQMASSEPRLLPCSRNGQLAIRENLLDVFPFHEFCLLPWYHHSQLTVYSKVAQQKVVPQRGNATVGEPRGQPPRDYTTEKQIEPYPTHDRISTLVFASALCPDWNGNLSRCSTHDHNIDRKIPILSEKMSEIESSVLLDCGGWKVFGSWHWPFSWIENESRSDKWNITNRCNNIHLLWAHYFYQPFSNFLLNHPRIVGTTPKKALENDDQWSESTKHTWSQER